MDVLRELRGWLRRLVTGAVPEEAAPVLDHRPLQTVLILVEHNPPAEADIVAIYAALVAEATGALVAHLAEHAELYAAHGRVDVEVERSVDDAFVLEGQLTRADMLGLLDLVEEESEAPPSSVPPRVVWAGANSVFSVPDAAPGYTARRRAAVHAAPERYGVVLAAVRWREATPVPAMGGVR